MAKLSRRQIRRIRHFFREKEERAKSVGEKFHHRSPSADGRRRESVVRLMAGRVDQMVIVASFLKPPLKTGLIDRFLVIAGAERVEPLIVFNKADLLESPEEGGEVAALYRGLGYPALLASTVTGEGIDLLRCQVEGRVSLLAGHSGVGKSSLLNALRDGIAESAEVREVSRATAKGVHTTTSIRLYHIDDRTTIFDLPGVKLVSLYDLAPLEIGRFFPEFASLAHSCRYDDCLHIREPECGVKRGLKEGLITRPRYESYLRMALNPQATE